MLRRLAKFFGMRHDAEAFNSFIVLTCYSAQSLYLLGCLSSFAEPPLVGLTCFGLRSGLAPLLRSRRSDVRRLAPSVTFTISDTLTEPTQTCLPEPFHFSQSQSLRGEELRLACVLRLSMRHQVMLMLCYSFADTLTATTRSELALL